MKEEGTRLKKRIKKKSQIVFIWHRFRKNKLAVFGLIVFIIMLLAAIFANLIVDYEKDVVSQNMSIRYSPPSREHIFVQESFMVQEYHYL